MGDLALCGSGPLCKHVAQRRFKHNRLQPPCLGLQIVMSCMYLAHHELESVLNVTIFINIIIIIITYFIAIFILIVNVIIVIIITTDCEPDESGPCN